MAYGHVRKARHHGHRAKPLETVKPEGRSPICHCAVQQAPTGPDTTPNRHIIEQNYDLSAAATKVGNGIEGGQPGSAAYGAVLLTVRSNAGPGRHD